MSGDATSTNGLFHEDIKILTTEMHTGGEPVRIIESGFPEPQGATILEKRAWFKKHADHYRKLVIFEPKGHHDMYGVIPVKPDIPEAAIGILFMDNKGYSSMCGHASIAFTRCVMLGLDF